jgi:transposase-like protein
VSTVWPQTIVQTCVIHLLRNSFHYASRKDWPAMAKDLKPIYSAATEAAALDRFVEFSARWEARYPAIRQTVGERLGRVRAVPELRRRRPGGDLHHG